MVECRVSAKRIDSHGSVAFTKDAEIVLDTDINGRPDVFNPAELFLAAIAASDQGHRARDRDARARTAAPQKETAERKEKAPDNRTEQDGHGADHIFITDVKLAAGGYRASKDAGFCGKPWAAASAVLPVGIGGCASRFEPINRWSCATDPSDRRSHDGAQRALAAI